MEQVDKPPGLGGGWDEGPAEPRKGTQSGNNKIGGGAGRRQLRREAVGGVEWGRAGGPLGPQARSWLALQVRADVASQMASRLTPLTLLLLLLLAGVSDPCEGQEGAGLRLTLQAPVNSESSSWDRHRGSSHQS